MKILNGAELADYIKERQARQVRALRQADGIVPRLAIVQTIDDPVIDTYVRLKSRYGADINVEVVAHKVAQAQVQATIEQLNNDVLVHGIIVQLPLADPEQTDAIVNMVAPQKDVDGLGAQATLDPATAMAIDWLVAAYNIELKGKSIVVVGMGRLVGAPLVKLWQTSNYDVTPLTRTTEDNTAKIKAADIVVTATGVPGLITADMLKIGAVVIDAGTASEGGVIRGDIAPDVYETRHDLTITPVKGGVGPLTVTALFDNVIRAARASLPPQQQQ